MSTLRDGSLALAAALVVGCSGSRNATPTNSAPATQMEVSVIPPQELKGHRPYVQFDTSIRQSDNNVGLTDPETN